jgi:hypothetical protein
MHVVNAFRTVEATNGRLKIVELLTNMFRYVAAPGWLERTKR